MGELVDLVSSGGKTGLGFVSTQDGITWGFRRFAAGHLCSFVEAHADLFRPHFGDYGLHQIREQPEDAPNNGWPSSDPGLRLGFIEAARDVALHGAQLEDLADDVAKLLGRRPGWTSGRLIALAVRAVNSAPGWVYGVKRRGWAPIAQDERRAMRELTSRYSQHRRGPSRIDRINVRIDADAVWR
jgi:hypothetical protein